MYIPSFYLELAAFMMSNEIKLCNSLAVCPRHAPSAYCWLVILSRNIALLSIMNISSTTSPSGLQVKLKTAPFASYTYGCSTSARPVDWKIIAADDQPGDEDHICCRTFNKGEDLNKLVAHSLNRYTKAIILVNIRDDYMVEPNMWPKEGNTPVFLLRNSDGYHLMSALEGHIQVWGKFDTENRTPRTPPSTQKVVDSSSTRPSSAKKGTRMLRHTSGFACSRIITMPIAEDPKVELKAESKQTPPTQKKSDTSPRRLLKRGYKSHLYGFFAYELAVLQGTHESR